MKEKIYFISVKSDKECKSDWLEFSSHKRRYNNVKNTPNSNSL